MPVFASHFTYKLRKASKESLIITLWDRLVIFFLKPPNSFPRSVTQRSSGNKKMENAPFFTVWSVFSFQKKNKEVSEWQSWLRLLYM